MTDYYKKYIKYKKKYINEKRKIKGGYDFENKLLERNYKLTDKDKELIAEKDYGLSGTFGTLSKEGLGDVLNKSKEYLENINEKKFIDIGSGDGRVVFWASDYGLKESTGVELSESRYNLSMNEYNKLPESKKKNINFIKDDINNVNLENKDIDIVYLSSLCMSDNLIYSITDKLSKELKKGALIFTSSELIKELNPQKKIINDKNIEFIKNFNVKQSWNKSSTLRMYRKI
jgi:SAM-dependent methyltransferase